MQKIKLHGTLTTKELKKHSPRPVGGAEMGSQVERTLHKAAAGGPGRARWGLAEQAVPHSRANKPGGTTWEQDRPHNLGLQLREIKLQTSD